jgi:preprotein translocase subunit SecE
MADSAEQTNSSLDTLKLVIAALVFVAGLAGFYLYADQPQLYRVLGLLVFVIIAAAIGLTTSKGQALTGFMQAARTEVRKMVWPTRAETLQTTLMILIVVVIVAIFLWGLDRILAWILRLLIG